MRVLGIDMGYANFAWCLIDTEVSVTRPTHWVVERIWTKPARSKKWKPTNDQLFEAMYSWCDQHDTLLRGVDAILLERQMRDKFIIMNTVIRTRYHGKIEMLHPSSVARTFHLRTGRDKKKADAVKICEHNMEGLPKGKRKRDDMADAALMCLHHLNKKQALSVEPFLCDFGE